jgi:hypothetical protein
MEPIKQIVMDFIRFNGPVLPAHVAKKIEKDMIQAGALLSDLFSDKLIKISKAKIGGSPVYYVSGQEAKLEKLYDYLPGKEKEAFNILKEKKVVKDSEMVAGIRVALRSIRDFAVPFKNGEDIYWKWYMLPNEQVEQYLPKLVSIPEVKKPEIKEVVKSLVRKVLGKNEFFDDVKKYLGENKIEIVREEFNKRSEVSFVVRVGSDIGQLEFLAVARNKKKISDVDLTMAHSKGQKMKLPVIFVSPGGLTKKAEKYLDKNFYVVFKSMNS